MIRRLSFLLAVAMTVGVLLCGCSENNAPTTGTTLPQSSQADSQPSVESYPFDTAFHEAVRCYIGFLETSRTSLTDAILEYCYYKNPDTKELALEASLKCDNVLSYEILRFEKLSDKLWEVERFLSSERNVYGSYAVNYVGIIDGEYRVITGIREIPDELKDGVEIEPYEPHGPGLVKPDEILG